jgi:hypothetical protein
MTHSRSRESDLHPTHFSLPDSSSTQHSHHTTPPTTVSRKATKSHVRSLNTSQSELLPCLRTRERCVIHIPRHDRRTTIRWRWSASAQRMHTDTSHRVVRTGEGERTRTTTRSASLPSRRRVRVCRHHPHGRRRRCKPSSKSHGLTADIPRHRICTGRKDARQRPSRGRLLRR